MKVDISDLDVLKKRVDFEIPQEVISDEITKICRNISSTKQIKGFRPGRVPKDIVKRLFWTKIKADVINKLVPEYYDKVLEETGLNPISKPEFGDFDLEDGKPLLVKVTLGVKPLIEPKDYLGLEVEWKKAEAAEEDIEKMLKNLQEKNAQFEVVEDRPVKKGDMVIIDYAGTIKIEGKEEDKNEAKEEDRAEDKNILIQIEDKDEINDFSMSLLGMNKDESKKIEALLPEDFPLENLRGKNVELDVTVKEIKGKKLPSLDDEFAKDIGNYDSLDELKKFLRAQLDNSLEISSKNLAQNSIIEKLLDKNPYDPPEILIEERRKELLAETENRIRQKGSVIDNNYELEKAKFIQEDLTPMAKKDVQLSIILESVAKKEGLRVLDYEIDHQIKLIALQTNQKFEDLKETIKESGKWNNIRTSILVNKAMNLIMEKAVKRVKE